MLLTDQQFVGSVAPDTPAETARQARDKADLAVGRYEVALCPLIVTNVDCASRLMTDESDVYRPSVGRHRRGCRAAAAPVRWRVVAPGP